MGETWYLACDMQMFILSPLFIYPLWRWRKIGLAWALFSIMSIVGGTIAIFIIWDLPAMAFFTRFNFLLELNGETGLTVFYQRYR